jgi:DNA-binding protein Fis
VRELENAMERAVAMARGNRVVLEDLPEEISQAFRKPVVNVETVQPLKEVEKEYIIAVLELNNGNQTRTAEQLGIGTATLYRKLKQYGLTGQQTAKRNKSTSGSKSLESRIAWRCLFRARQYFGLRQACLSLDGERPIQLCR